MDLFLTLSPQDAAAYRLWARENYQPFEPISGCWHPVVQAECVAINSAAAARFSVPAAL